MNISFKKANAAHIDIIFEWLLEPHMVEFWDNSQEHKDDILNFIHDRPQYYFAGTTKYWIGYIDGEPYSFVLSDTLEKHQDDLSEIHRKNMSEAGVTISLDFGIGHKKYLGQGLAAPTLQAFVDFYKSLVDPLADTFFIDPDENNPRAKHVYGRAGFKSVGIFDVEKGAFKDGVSYLMIKKV